MPTTQYRRPDATQSKTGRRYQIQTSSTGLGTGFVLDEVHASPEHRIFRRWHFSFRPEPGDVLAQVERRLQR